MGHLYHGYVKYPEGTPWSSNLFAPRIHLHSQPMFSSPQPDSCTRCWGYTAIAESAVYLLLQLHAPVGALSATWVREAIEMTMTNEKELHHSQRIVKYHSLIYLKNTVSTAIGILGSTIPNFTMFMGGTKHQSIRLVIPVMVPVVNIWLIQRELDTLNTYTYKYIIYMHKHIDVEIPLLTLSHMSHSPADLCGSHHHEDGRSKP